jgi:hypothetical protein
MTVTFTLRNETPADLGAITEVTMAAFESLAISQQTEQFHRRGPARGRSAHGVARRRSPGAA